MDELKDMIALLKRADFDPAEIDTDLHKRVAAAVKDCFIKRFDMRTSSRDGDQTSSRDGDNGEVLIQDLSNESPCGCGMSKRL